MKKFLLCILIVNCQLAIVNSNAQPSISSGYPFTQIPFTQVKVAPNSFWGDRIRAAREVTIPLAFSKCESQHRYENFTAAAKHDASYDFKHKMLFPFDDTDVYKTIEGASYVLQTYPDNELKTYIDSVLDVVGAAQEPDGYLYTARTINPEHPHDWSGSRRWETEEVLSHELYNLGHMVDAACAHYQATGSSKFLDIAKRYADCVCHEVGAGNNQQTVVPGHQIAEMALARLYLLTGEKRYLDEAKYMLDYRGKTKIHDIYSQSEKPILEQTEAWGHAVRAGYMYSGIADVAALTGDSAYIKTIDNIWQNIVTRKMYITGGVGARHEGEAFGADYELPNLTAYNETCAAIAQVYLNYRMFLLHGDAKYIDCLERVLYNGVISGMSVDGGKFFYPNPLSSDGKYAFNSDNTTTRQPWFGCACCPSNLCRFIPSVPEYMYAVKDKDIYLNLFAANEVNVDLGGKKVVLEETTNYPWDGDVTVRVKEAKQKQFSLRIRIPGWVRGSVLPGDLYSYCDGKSLGFYIDVNGNKVDTSTMENGYVTVSRLWKKGDVVNIHFDMQPRLVCANDKVKDDAGLVAVECGPLVYCAETADNQGEDIHRAILNARPQFVVNRDYGIKNIEGDGKVFKVTSLTTAVQIPWLESNGTLGLKNQTLTFIPYYAWNHRGAGVMDVWHSIAR